MGSSPSVHSSVVSSGVKKPGPGPGEIDVGSFRINLDDSIGKGTFGSVCMAQVIDTGLPIAAKGILVADRWNQNDDLKSMAMEEGARMRACSHPNIVKLYDHYEHGNKVWLFMEFCDQGDLNHYLGQNPNMSFNEKLRIMYETTLAVSYLHNHDIVHRDIKPENILMKSVENKSIVKLGDFGYAKIYDYTVSQPTFSAQINRTTAGTPAFWAPEFFLLQENLSYTASVDIFSLGLIFAAVYNYGPTNKSTFPISVESKLKSKEEIFGRQMAENFRAKLPLPNLVELCDGDNRITVDFKQLIVNMTKVESNDREKIHDVEAAMKSLQEYDDLSDLLPDMPLQFNTEHSSIRLSELLNSELRSIHQVDISEIPLCLKLIANELWSCQLDGITVYDHKLNVVRTMKVNSDDQWVHSVAMVADDVVAVAGNYHLYISSTSGEFIQTISKLDIYDLALYNDKLYATDVHSPVIHVYDCHTWQRLHSISSPCKDNEHDFHNQRLSVNKTGIKLSCHDCDTIYILDLEGNLKQTHGPEIAIAAISSAVSEGEQNNLDWPFICQEDDDGAVMVADYRNDRLLVLTTGQWRQVRVNESLIRPDGVYWRGRLYVSSFRDETLTMFR